MLFSHVRALYKLQSHATLFMVSSQVESEQFYRMMKQTNLQFVAPCVQNVLHLAYVLLWDKHLCHSRLEGVWAVRPGPLRRHLQPVKGSVWERWHPARWPACYLLSWKAKKKTEYHCKMKQQCSFWAYLILWEVNMQLDLTPFCFFVILVHFTMRGSWVCGRLNNQGGGQRWSHTPARMPPISGFSGSIWWKLREMREGSQWERHNDE